jgi:hypothetical protein
MPVEYSDSTFRNVRSLILFILHFYNAFFLLKGIINRPNNRCNALPHLRLWSPAEVEEEAEAR